MIQFISSNIFFRFMYSDVTKDGYMYQILKLTISHSKKVLHKPDITNRYNLFCVDMPPLRLFYSGKRQNVKRISKKLGS